MTNSLIFDATDAAQSWRQEQPTPMLRFVRKDGKLILQQMWQITTLNSQTSDWRDVPIETLETPAPFWDLDSVK